MFVIFNTLRHNRKHVHDLLPCHIWYVSVGFSIVYHAQTAKKQNTLEWKRTYWVTLFSTWHIVIMKNISSPPSLVKKHPRLNIYKTLLAYGRKARVTRKLTKRDRWHQKWNLRKEVRVTYHYIINEAFKTKIIINFL